MDYSIKSMTNDASIIIRLTKKEKATLQKLALLEGKNMTDYIKSRVFNLENENIKHAEKAAQLPQNTSEKVEQYLDLISKVVLANNAILSKTIAKDFTEQDKESLKNEINDKVAKLFEVK